MRLPVDFSRMSVITISVLFFIVVCANVVCANEATPEEALQKLQEPTCSSACHKKKSDHYRTRASIDIAASAECVWQAIHDERDYDPDIIYNKVISRPGPFEMILEQKYRHVPFFGTAVCRLKNVELPGQRIDYSLEYSDHLKALEGSWVLTVTGASSTKLELSSFCDAGFPIPKMLYEPFALVQLQKRLALVKRLAEKKL